MTTQPSNRIRNRRRVAIAVLVLLMVVLFLVFVVLGREGFEKQYIEYNAAELRYEEAAYKPGTESNPVRQQVNMLLAQVLQVAMTPQERIAKSREGIAFLNTIEEEIDDIKVKGDAVVPLLDALERQARSPGNIVRKEELLQLVSLGRRQVEIVSDIRGLSYRADYYSSEIFERIIDDNGEITDVHKQYLNDQIPQLEEQFNRRANLYTELGSNRERMVRLFTELGGKTPSGQPVGIGSAD